MKYLLFTLIILFTIIVAGCFGYSQSIIFPKEHYGYLSYFTSIIGGVFIGHLGGSTINYYNDIL